MTYADCTCDDESSMVLRAGETRMKLDVGDIVESQASDVKFLGRCIDAAQLRLRVDWL